MNMPASDRPRISPDVAAALVSAAPNRIQKKLDKQPDMADQWTWQTTDAGCEVDTGKEKVTLRGDSGRLTSADQINCSCLLSPRCLHIAAVVTSLELEDESEHETESATESPEAESAEQTAEAGASVSTDGPSLSARAEAAADLAWDAFVEMLETGAQGAGVVIQSQLLRVIHACRTEGLHRLAAIGQRLLQSVRQLRSRSDEFQSNVMLNDLLNLGSVSWQLRASRNGDLNHFNDLSDLNDLLGVARRRYDAIQGLRLAALFTEPILTQSGYAGVATTLLADDNSVFSISNVRPGESDRVEIAWRSALELGGLTCSHRDLGATGILLSTGAASADGRLSAGQKTRAATIKMRQWGGDAGEQRFAEPIGDQVARAIDSQMDDEPGSDLLFLQGHVAGRGAAGTVFVSNDHAIQLTPANDRSELPYRDNLEVLSRAPGAALRVIARLESGRPASAAPLAIASLDCPADVGTDRVQLVLPDDWGGRADLGLRRLQPSYFSRTERKPALVPATTTTVVDDGLQRMRRRLFSLAMGGLLGAGGGRRDGSLATRFIDGLARDSRELASNMQPTAAALLAHLASVASRTKTDVEGLRQTMTEPIAEAWLASGVYERAARARFQRETWLAAAQDA